MRLTPLLLLLLIAGCNNGPSLNTDGTTNPDAKSLAPADPKLAAVYERSCKACHSRGLSGAPRTGNKDDWQPRIAKGMNVLVQNTLSGLNSMPPRGACMDCNPADYERLIRFMAAWPTAQSSTANNPEAQSSGN